MSTLNTIPLIIGRKRSQLVGDPAPGANCVIDAMNPGRSLLVNLSFDFLADANVATRYITIDHYQPPVPFVIGLSTAGIVATGGVSAVVNPFVGALINVTGTLLTIPCAWDPNFDTGHDLRIIIKNIQAGDQISNVRVLWSYWQTER